MDFSPALSRVRTPAARCSWHKLPSQGLNVLALCTFACALCFRPCASYLFFQDSTQNFTFSIKTHWTITLKLGAHHTVGELYLKKIKAKERTSPPPRSFPGTASFPPPLSSPRRFGHGAWQFQSLGVSFPWAQEPKGGLLVPLVIIQMDYSLLCLLHIPPPVFFHADIISASWGFVHYRITMSKEAFLIFLPFLLTSRNTNSNFAFIIQTCPIHSSIHVSNQPPIHSAIHPSLISKYHKLWVPQTRLKLWLFYLTE